MVRQSNNLIGSLNILTFLMSVPILWAGIWLRHRAASECDRFLEKPLIALGVFVMLLSLAGIIGACCRVSWLLWLYLLAMFLLFCFTVFAFLVTNKEYRLGDYSNWLHKRVSSADNWSKIRSCLVDSNVCTKYLHNTVEELYTPVESGCCMPSKECNFNLTYVDCNVWDDKASTLCFDCQSCKAGFLDNIKRDRKKAAVLNTGLVFVLIIVYSIGCCAFRNNTHHNSYP